jgi:flagellar biogenesis protein FliO
VKRFGWAWLLAAAWALAFALPSHAASPPASQPSAASLPDPMANQPIVRNDSIPAQPTGGQNLGSGSSYDLSGARITLALAAVIGLIFLLRYGGRKIFPAAIAAGRTSAVKVLARCPLSPRQQILLVQVGRRVMVISDSSSQLNCLSQITDADEVAALLGEIQRQKSSPVAGPFTAWFKRAADSFAGDETEWTDPASAEAAHAQPQESNTDLPALGDDSPAQAIRQEIRGLTERVRRMARQLGGTNRRA